MKKIDVNIHKESSIHRVDISVQMNIVLPSLLFSCIVNVVKQAFFDVAREVLRQILEKLDNIWSKEKDRNIRICRFVTRTLRCCLGEVKFKYRQARKEGKHFRPLLETLGIDRYQRITDDAKAQAILASLYTSYRKALKIANCSFSLSTLWNSVQKEGKFYRDKRKKAMWYYSQGVPTKPASPSDFAILMMDEIWLRHVKKRKWLYVKVARLAVARRNGDEITFEPLRVYAAIASQKTFLKEAKLFFETTAELSQIQHIAVLTDGCSMGKKFCEFYPGQAVWQLDWWHLWDHVHKGCKFEKGLDKKIWDLLNAGKLEGAIAILSAYLEGMLSVEKKIREATKGMENIAGVGADVFWSASRRKNLEDLIKYLKNNRDGIYGVEAFVGKIPGEYLPFGTGPVERLQAVMIAYRMKKQGKHWSVDGAENLVALLSREWNSEDVEMTLNCCLADLASWEKLNRMVESGKTSSEKLPVRGKRNCKGKGRGKGKRVDFSPLPESTVYLLRRGKVESVYHPLQNISEMKMLPNFLDQSMVERRDAVLCA